MTLLDSFVLGGLAGAIFGWSLMAFSENRRIRQLETQLGCADASRIHWQNRAELAEGYAECAKQVDAIEKELRG